LPFEKIENLKPGTNAVFKIGDYVLKIFVPAGIGDGYGTNIDVEIFGMRFANERKVPAPKLIAWGEFSDKYRFQYMIMEYINGKTLDEAEKYLSYNDKVTIGKKVREITDKLNAPCENFTSVDAIEHSKNDGEWAACGFPPSFLKERLEYLNTLKIENRDKVYCQCDFHAENVLVDKDLNVYLIDFADAMYVPKEYEKAYVASALFCFEKPYMTGFFGDYKTEEIVELCMTYLPFHAWGHSTLAGNFKPVSEITSFKVMREKLRELIEKEKAANN
jgi:serine/threonine protein kinase